MSNQMEVYGFQITGRRATIAIAVFAAGFSAASMILAKRRENRERAALARREGKLRIGVLALLTTARRLIGHRPETVSASMVSADADCLKAIVVHVDKLAMEDMDLGLQQIVADLRMHIIVLVETENISLLQMRWAYQFIFTALMRLTMRYGDTSRDLYSIQVGGKTFLEEHKSFRDFNNREAEEAMRDAAEGIASMRDLFRELKEAHRDSRNYARAFERDRGAPDEDFDHREILGDD